MKRIVWLMLFLGTAGVAVYRARGAAQGTLPGSAGSSKFTATALLSFGVGEDATCAVQVTGPVKIKWDDIVKQSNDVTTLTMEIESLDMSGVDPVFGEFRVLAGSNDVGRVSPGFAVANTNITTTMFFDVFAEIQLPNDVTVVNLAPMRLIGQIPDWPPGTSSLIGIVPVALVDPVTSNQVGTLNSFTLLASSDGKNLLRSLSFNVVGSRNDPGAYISTTCTNDLRGTVITVENSNLLGVASSSPGCNEITDTNLLFSCRWNMAVRPPTWRGYHSGNWILYRLDSNSHTNVWASGKLQGTNGVGTHRAPLSNASEDCAPCGHFEGSMTGKIIERGSDLNNGRINATYAGDFLDFEGAPISCCPAPPAPPAGPFRMTIDGMVLTKCPVTNKQ